MLMDLTVQIPMEFIAKAGYEWLENGCKRRQAIFELFPEEGWRYYWCCMPNRGIGSDNGYGVGHRCSKGCVLRIEFDFSTSSILYKGKEE